MEERRYFLVLEQRNRSRQRKKALVLASLVSALMLLIWFASHA